MADLNRIEAADGGMLYCEAGASVDAAADAACAAGFAGLDSFYGMPGTIGGGIWMNARCYGRSFSDILSTVTRLDPSGELITESLSGFRFRLQEIPPSRR